MVRLCMVGNVYSVDKDSHSRVTELLLECRGGAVCHMGHV